MLVTDVGGLAEIIPHKKLGYVTSLEPNSVADAIVDFYTNNREEEFAAKPRKRKKIYLEKPCSNNPRNG